MANNKNVKIQSTKKKNNKQWIFIISVVVALSMVISSLYTFTQGSDSGTQNDQTTPMIQYNSYKVTPYSSPNPILVKVNQTNKQYIALVNSQPLCVSNQVIGWVYNLSVPGVSGVIMDAANPIVQTNAICAETYILFRFSLLNPSNETLTRLENELNNRLGTYFMKQVYSGTIMNGSIPTAGNIDVIGNLDTVSGDLVEIIVFQTDNSNIIALEKQKIYFGPTVPGKVLSVDDLIARGTINDSFNSTGFEDLNISGSNINLPKMSVNMNLSNNLSKEISNIAGVSININGNITEITFNDSLKQVSSILTGAGINYSLINGSASFQMPANTSVAQAKKDLEDRGLLDATFKKSGQVALPQSVIFGNISATIPNNANFTTTLELSTKAGDNINVSLTALQFGNQIFIAGAKQEA